VRKASAPAAAKPRPAPEAPTAPGWLSVDANPWAQVFIDGREIDRTPIARYPLPPGKYRVLFKNPERGKQEAREVTVESGKAAALTVDLR
jgi:hypothetical protein